MIAKLKTGILVLIMAGSTGATVIHVPADQPTIQAGIDASVNGDTVIVALGEYFENITFRSKSIVLASDYLLTGDANAIRTTIINGSQPHNPDTGSVVLMPGGQTTATRLVGFTITGGTGTIWRDISDNLLYREGGGILSEGGAPRIERNIIIDNEATLYPPNADGGGGLRVGFGAASLIGNVIAYNHGRYGGGGVFFHADAVISNNIVWKNWGGEAFGGGGFWIVSGTSADLKNNTIVGNSSATTGGGIQQSGQAATYENNIIRDNTSIGAGPQIRLGAGTGGTSVQYTDIQGGFTGTANWDGNPQFATSDFLLQASSPCIDSGVNASLYNDRPDPGNSSLALWPSQGARRNDVGACGGPDAREFPVFTSPEFSLSTDSIGFLATSVGDTSRAWIKFAKTWFGPVRIDSVRFKHAPTSTLLATSTMPHTTDISRGPDSIQVGWSPQALGDMVDTALVYQRDSTTISPLVVVVTGQTLGCCVAGTGNVDCDPTDGVDIGDLTSLIDNLFITFTPLCCEAEANCDGSGGIDIGDLTTLIDNLFITFSPLAACH